MIPEVTLRVDVEATMHDAGAITHYAEDLGLRPILVITARRWVVLMSALSPLRIEPRPRNMVSGSEYDVWNAVAVEWGDWRVLVNGSPIEDDAESAHAAWNSTIAAGMPF